MNIGTHRIRIRFQADPVISGVNAAIPDLHVVAGVNIHAVIVMASMGTDDQIMDLHMTAFDVMLHPENGILHRQSGHFHIFTIPEPDHPGFGPVNRHIMRRIKGTAPVDHSFAFQGDIFLIQGKKQRADPVPAFVKGNGGGIVMVFTIKSTNSQNNLYNKWLDNFEKQIGLEKKRARYSSLLYNATQTIQSFYPLCIFLGGYLLV